MRPSTATAIVLLASAVGCGGSTITDAGVDAAQDGSADADGAAIIGYCSADWGWVDASAPDPQRSIFPCKSGEKCERGNGATGQYVCCTPNGVNPYCK